MKVRDSLVPLAAAIAALTGGMVALQGRFNGDLTAAGGGPLLAGWSSYLGTFVTVIVLILIRRQGGQAWKVLRTRSSWWWYAIGLSGIPIVLAMSWGIPLVGVAITSVCSVAGQTVAGLLLDSRGVGLPAPLKLTGRRIAAALISILGLSLAIGSSLGGDAKVLTMIAVGVVVFAAGMILCIQQAGNGSVTALSGNPLFASLTSVMGGGAGISLIVLGAWAVGALGDVSFPPVSEYWWAYLGGPLGAGVVVGAAWAVRHLGTFRLTLAVVAGQMVTAMILDAFGTTGLSWPTVVASAVVVAATILVVSPSSPKKSASLQP